MSDKMEAKWLEQYEADPRDFKVWDILWNPTDKDIQELPNKTENRKLTPKTINQGCVPSCTASAGTNVLLFQNAKEKDFKMNSIHIDNEYIREMMWHENVCDETGDYLENFLKTITKHQPIWTINEKGWTFPISRYSFEKMPETDQEFEEMKYWIYHQWPLYFATLGNKTLRKELNDWEAKTIVTPETRTGWHALWWIIDYDDKKEELWCLNTWNPNYERDNKKPISMFKMSYNYFKRAIKSWQFSWRYWIIYDKMEEVDEPRLFPDYNPEQDTEQYKAVKWAKDNNIIKGAKHSDGDRYLEPHRPLTRLEMILILYRSNNKQ